MPLDLMPPALSPGMSRHRAGERAPPSRRVHESNGAMMLVETSRGDVDVLGPVTTHSEAESIAWHLLHAAGHRDALPVTLHKLAVAYLASRGKVTL